MNAPTTFITHPFPFPKPLTRPTRTRQQILATTSNNPRTPSTPDAGLIPKPGITGTVCANLWPLPVFGAYSWFLNVYDREIAASVGPFVVTSTTSGLQMEFQPGRTPQPSNRSNAYQVFRGIATGNINVRKAVHDMHAGDYQLCLFEKGGSENFLQRRNEVHVKPEPVEESFDSSWDDPAPTYRTVSRASNYEVREVYAGGGATPRATSPLEYFAMNLFPIFPFSRYSCLVVVWKQRRGLSPLAIDKRGKRINLSFFDPLEIEQAVDDTPQPIARFAVKVFFGAVTDDSAATVHKVLLDSIASSPSTRVLSKTDFRLVVDNTPYTITPNRRNEMWVQVA